MSILTRLYYNIKAAIVLSFLAMTLSPLVPTMGIVYILVRPFSKVTYLKFASFIQMSWLSVEVFLVEDVCGIKMRVTGDLPSREPALCISNHLTHDYVMIYSLGYRMGTLAHTRAIIKNSIRYTPFLGPAIWMCYWPFVSRDFKKDIKNLKSLFSLYRDAKMPAQIWIFPEGTRLTPSKLRSSQEYAAAKGYPVWKNVMLPKYRGFCTALDSMKETFRLVNDYTIQFEGWNGVPGLWQMLSSDSSKPHTVHVHIKRHQIADVPEDEEGRHQWLIARFNEKEELLEQFKTDKRFPGQEITRKHAVKDIIVHPIVFGIASFFLCQTGVRLVSAAV
eukprot:CAMPEP_0176407270 /NCGR_PEP_ID=MMETSP0127-20121128/1322_1 /TAXON_ID=938130 /ORGANISM="Platyophrya macrostoma, Strain WH" /LENGTH=332 /DNA_ID=CAMNT_0017786465 /DNA_START=54 /DNA_END=1049 /DNA_ORIENTATION=+